ncbi:YidC/Oxa1 family membrane protein insertase [Companilactobacillus sp. RD055328]|uniref:YidC/Oxa1 family membrane protein insertase n=1 Tax=Companilactobacillus sp. RD055328 TaxID=2916634 RepID=UPI0035CEF992
MVVLTGCSQNYYNEPITSSTPGFWSHYVVYSFSRFILWLASLVGNSYGWAIVLFTIIIRIVLLPLNYYQIKSMNKQQALQPQIKELQKKYPGKDMESRQKMSEEQQKLYSDAGINPFASLLPMLIQLPVMFALYQAIFKTQELRTGSFLWMQLGKPDPYYIMAILAALFTLLSTYISSISQPNQTGITKIMMFTMPLIIFFPALTFASAITIYWVVTNAFQVLQTLILQNPFKFRREQREKEEAEKEKQKAIRKAKKKAFKKK